MISFKFCINLKGEFNAHVSNEVGKILQAESDFKAKKMEESNVSAQGNKAEMHVTSAQGRFARKAGVGGQ